MGIFIFRGLTIFGVLLGCTATAQVRINEIMYHAVTENPAEEFIELHNRSATNVNLTGWSFTKGVAFTLPAGQILPAGGFLVVAANTNTFAVRYP